MFDVKKINSALLALSLSLSAIAHGQVLQPTPKHDNQSQRHLVIQVGGYVGSQGRAQNVMIEGLRGNQYTLTHQKPSNGLFGLGYYIDEPDEGAFQLSYGVNGLYLGPTSVNGQIVLEHFRTNFDYSYHIQQIPVYFATKAIIHNSQQKYNITIDAGIGSNFMRVAQYNEAPLTNMSVAQPNFSAQNNVAFTAMAGMGLRLNKIFGQAPLECAYRFFYLGEGQLHINNNLYQNTLRTGNTYANAVLCSIAV